MRQFLLWFAAALISITVTALFFCPAAWLSYALEKQTGGRLTLGDAQGTLWSGSAFVGGAPGKNDPVTPLFPGRFYWQVSPKLLFDQVDAQVTNTSSLSQALNVTGTWSQWQVSPATVVLPADRLSGLGAPLNTMQVSGEMKLSWGPMLLLRDGDKLSITGTVHLDLNDIASRLSLVKPLGSYRLKMVWTGQDAQMDLATAVGPMLLSGAGTVTNGRFHFSGKAEAETGQEQKLANLLNLLGQRRREGDKDVFALKL